MDTKALIKYLERKGCIQALCKVLIEVDRRQDNLQDPVAFIRENLDPDLTKMYRTLQAEIEEATAELTQLSEQYPVEYAKFLKTKKRKGKGKGKGKVKKK